jgi:hypothetical protein
MTVKLLIKNKKSFSGEGCLAPARRDLPVSRQDLPAARGHDPGFEPALVVLIPGKSGPGSL